MTTSHALARRRAWPEPLKVDNTQPKLDTVVAALSLKGPTNERWKILDEVNGLTSEDAKRKVRLLDGQFSVAVHMLCRASGMKPGQNVACCDYQCVLVLLRILRHRSQKLKSLSFVIAVR